MTSLAWKERGSNKGHCTCFFRAMCDVFSDIFISFAKRERVCIFEAVKSADCTMVNSYANIKDLSIPCCAWISQLGKLRGGDLKMDPIKK